MIARLVKLTSPYGLVSPAAVAAALFVTGCVITPGALSVNRKASLDKVQIAVALPEDTDLDSYSGGTEWNRARLTLSRNDGGGADLVQPLEGVKGGLKAKAPLKNLDPGDFYRVDLELIYDDPSGLEKVVARGAVGTDGGDVLTLKPGSNTVKVPVAPTTKGDKIALEPTVKKASTDDDEDDDKKISGEDPTDELIVTLIGAVVDALGDKKKASPTPAPSKK